MTIRAYLRHRERLAKLVLGVCCALILIAALWYLTAAPSVKPSGLVVLGILAALGTVMVALQQQLVRCPRCDGGLIRLYTQIAQQDVTACPHCHASFDAPYTP